MPASRWRQHAARSDRQFARAQRLLRREAERGEPVFVSHLVLLETEWMLRSRYGLSTTEILRAFSGLLESAVLQIEAETSVEQALFIWKDSPAEFADPRGDSGRAPERSLECLRADVGGPS